MNNITTTKIYAYIYKIEMLGIGERWVEEIYFGQPCMLSIYLQPKERFP